MKLSNLVLLGIAVCAFLAISGTATEEIRKCNHDSGCLMGEFCGPGNYDGQICQPCKLCSDDYQRQNGSSTCPRNDRDCGPCLKGQQEEPSTLGNNFPKCRPSPIPGYQVTPHNPVSGSNFEEGIANWFQNSTNIAILIGCIILTILLILLIGHISCSCCKTQGYQKTHIEDVEQLASSPLPSAPSINNDMAQSVQEQPPSNPDYHSDSPPPYSPGSAIHHRVEIAQNEKERLVSATPYNRDEYEKNCIRNHGGANIMPNDQHIFIPDQDSQEHSPLSPARSESPTESVSSNITVPSGWIPSSTKTLAPVLANLPEEEEEVESNRDLGSDDEDYVNDNSAVSLQMEVSFELVEGEEMFEMQNVTDSGNSSALQSTTSIPNSLAYPSSATNDSAYSMNTLDHETTNLLEQNTILPNSRSHSLASLPVIAEPTPDPSTERRKRPRSDSVNNSERTRLPNKYRPHPDADQ